MEEIVGGFVGIVIMVGMLLPQIVMIVKFWVGVIRWAMALGNRVETQGE